MALKLPNVYLASLEDEYIPTQYSPGSRRRAAQLQSFLRMFQLEVSKRLTSPSVNFLVLNHKDWRQLYSYTYGLPFVHHRRGIRLVAAAQYPERLLRKFDSVLLRALGQSLQKPGELREYMDLRLGFEWGRAAIYSSGLATRLKWLDTLMSSHLFFLVLKEAGADDLYKRVLAWAEFEFASSGIDNLAMSDYQYPHVKLPLEKRLYFQGWLSLKAAELAESRSWDILREMELGLKQTPREKIEEFMYKLDDRLRLEKALGS